MSTDIPFGAHPPDSGGVSTTSVMQASSYFGASSGSSPTDANPFHFVGTGAPPSQAAHQPPHQLQLGPPSASDLFSQNNPNVNIFNPGAAAVVGGGGGADMSAGARQHQNQLGFASSAFGVPSVSTAPAQAPPASSMFTGHNEVTAFDGDKRQLYYQQRHSLPESSNLFGAAAPQHNNPVGQPTHGGQDIFSSFPSQRQPSSLPSSNSQEVQSHPPAAPRPFSQEPPSLPRNQPKAGGSISAPSTTLHQVLPSAHDQPQLQSAFSDHSQPISGQTGLAESSNSSLSPTFRPPSNADMHGGLQHRVLDYPMTNADYMDSSVPLSMNSSGMLPNQMHPSLTEDLGITNASHGSHTTNLRTNASVDNDLDAISAAIQDATTPDDVTTPMQWGQSSSNDEHSSSDRERSGSLNKSVSSLLDGSQEDFSHYSPIRLLPPAPLGGEISPQQSQSPSSACASLLPSLGPQGGEERVDSREQARDPTEYGHEKKASDDLKDWEIVDSIPPASEVSQLPSSVKLLPPSSFTSVSAETIHSSSAADTVAGVSQAMQHVSLGSPQREGGSLAHPSAASTVHDQSSRGTASITAITTSSASVSTTAGHANVVGDKITSVSHLHTNFTNSETARVTHQASHHRPGPSHSEFHLSSNLPEPKDISSLINQIPFLTPVAPSSSSQTLLPACTGATSTSTSTVLSMHDVATATTTSTTSVNLVHPFSSSMQSNRQPLQPLPLPPVATSSSSSVQRTGPPHLQQQQLLAPEQLSLPPPPTVGGSPTGRGGVGSIQQVYQQQQQGGGGLVQLPHAEPVSQVQAPPAVTTSSSLHTDAVRQTGVGDNVTQHHPASVQPSQPPAQTVSSAFEVPLAAQEHLTPPPLPAATIGQPMTATDHQVMDEAIQPAPPPLPQTSAFVNVQHPRQTVEYSNPHHPPPLPSQPRQLPDPSLPPPSLSTNLPAPPSHSQRGEVEAHVPAPSTAMSMSQQQQAVHPPPSPTTTTGHSHTPNQPTDQQLSSSSQPMSVVSREHQPQLPSQVTSDVSKSSSSAPSTDQLASYQHKEERTEPPVQHRPDDQGYGHHDSYYLHERERGGPSYYGDPRYNRAPSAFSERDSEQYHHGYHHHQGPESRQRYDYPHYPDYPADPGYRYGPAYGYGDHYRRGVYPPLYGPPGGRSAFQDEYGMPVCPPYFDHYGPYGGGYHQPRYGGHYPPPPGGEYYGGEYAQDSSYYYPSESYEHDPRYQQHPSEAGYEAYGYGPTQSHDGAPAHEDLNPAEASAIVGQTNNFEVSQFVESPNVHLPGRLHAHQLQHNSTAYLDSQHQQHIYDGQPDALYPSDHGYPHTEQGYVQGQSEAWYYGHDGQYHEGDGSYNTALYYDHQGGEYQTEEVPTEPVVEATPPPPPRETPELFAHPHVRATFGFGGQLVTIVPKYLSLGSSPVVEITFIKDHVNDFETQDLIEAVNSSPSPFLPGDTPKSQVVRFASREAQKCRDKIAEVAGNQEALKRLEDEALLWDFLVLLCQQNGVIVTSDVSDLLIKDVNPSVVKPVPQTSAGATQDESLDILRQLLFTGRKRDAVDIACSKGLWGHALMLASRMDEQTRTYVVNRFTASLVNTDPLSTFYTLLLGRTPSAVKPEGLPRAGDWKPHLAMILANRMSKLENVSVVSLGDSLLAQKRLHAAHLCYHLANVHYGAYGNPDSKYSLLGTDHSHLAIGSYPSPADLHMMEVLEYAMSLSKQDFLMPNFQLFKFLYVFKLLELGFASKALKYCEQISCSAVSKNPHCFAPVFLHLLVEVSVRLHHLCSQFDVVENEYPSWLHQLQQLVSDALSSDFAPSLMSPSPAFSSVSQGYGGQQQMSSQPIIGLQQTMTATSGGHLDVPGTAGGSSRVESGASSKEGSVINMKIDVTTAHLRMRDPPPAVAASTGHSHEGKTEHQQEQSSTGPTQTYITAQYPTGQQQQQPAGVSEGQTLAQSQPQFHMGTTGETGYRQFGTSPDVAQPSFTSSTGNQQQQEEQNVTSHWQAQVVPTQQNDAGTQQHQYQHQQEMMSSQVSHAASQQTEGIVGERTEAVQMGYGQYFEQPGSAHQLPTQDQSSTQPPSSQAPPTQPGYPSQGGYDYYNQWQPTESMSHHHGSQTSPEGTHYGREQEAESSSKVGVESAPSRDSHVTKKTEGEEKESSSGKDENRKASGQKNGKGGQQQQPSGGWGSSFIKFFMPKKKNEAHLPDDKNPTIVWDEEKNRWVDLTADEQEQSGPPPPPTDAELTRTGPSNSASMPPGGRSGQPPPPATQPGHLPPSSVTGGPSQLASSGGVGTDVTNQDATSKTYSLQMRKRGRLGIRSKYVDVLNPEGSKSSSSGPPPPGPPTLMPGPPRPFSGTFFVPQQPPVDSSGEISETPAPLPEASACDTTAPTNTALTSEASGSSRSQVPSSSHGPTASGERESREQVQTGQPSAQEVYQRQSLFQNQPEVTSQPPLQSASATTYPGDSQRFRADETPASSQPQPVPQLPQFFNPGAFAPVNAFPQVPPAANAGEPQDDALSTVSLISESSQEVSQYMNRQAPSTTSAGYNRLKQGIRGIKPYPSGIVGRNQQQRPHPGPGLQPTRPPPLGMGSTIFQPRQHS